MAISLRVLLIEDSPDDALLLERELERGGFSPSIQRVETEAAIRAALETWEWDVVICDYSLPQIGGLKALCIYRQMGPDMPFIIVSGAIGEEIAVRMMKSGAHDYVMKDNLARLATAVRRELDSAQERRARKEAEAEVARLATLAETRRQLEDRERLQLIQDLSEALERVKTLSGLLPICAGCKKIRNDAGSWQAIELYIKEHSNAEFSHGLCPECARRLYPDIPFTFTESFECSDPNSHSRRPELDNGCNRRL
jgi:CheY-like chemotaxis protein